MKTHSCIKIKNELGIVAARQAGRNLAKDLGFGTVDQARITTAISELARNIYLYAKVGEISVEYIEENWKKGLKVIAADTGPGIEDIRQALEDGFTTSGGLGAGLPGVRRLMDEFSIESTVGKGTLVIAVKWLHK